MSFRLRNSMNNIQYYTVIVDKGQLIEDREDTARVILRPKKPTPRFKRNFEQIVYDRHTGEWKTATTWNS